MKNRINYFLLVLWLAAFLSFGSRLYSRTLEYEKGKQEYRELGRIFSEYRTEPENTDDNMEEITEEYLRNKNPDYIFWLRIPGTSIDYPVVRSLKPGFYLNHTFYGTENSCGSLFVQSEISGLNNGNTVIFGHNMKDGTMFSELKDYRDSYFFKNHNIIWIFESGKWYQGEIFSCQLREKQDLQCYQTGFLNKKEKQEFLDDMKASSLYEISVSPSVKRPVITLSTCYGHSKRMIVQAVLMCYTE